MKKLDVFWAPAPFNSTEEQWNIHYQEPQPVFGIFRKQKNPRFTKCPATMDHGKKLYRIDATASDRHTFESGFLRSLTNVPNGTFFNGGGLIGLGKFNESSLENYVNVQYNLSWYFWTKEPMLTKFTAPYFPATYPTKGALLAPGQFDIGRWFRQFNLDYHLPITSTSFIIEKTDPLFFVEFVTERPIAFRRFILTPELAQLGDEMAQQSVRLPKIPLLERYEMAKKSNLMGLVSKLIHEAVID